MKFLVQLAADDIRCLEDYLNTEGSLAVKDVIGDIDVSLILARTNIAGQMYFVAYDCNTGTQYTDIQCFPLLSKLNVLHLFAVQSKIAALRKAEAQVA